MLFSETEINKILNSVNNVLTSKVLVYISVAEKIYKEEKYLKCVWRGIKLYKSNLKIGEKSLNIDHTTRY